MDSNPLIRYVQDGKVYPRTLSKTYRKWSSMIQRCTNPRHPAYEYYGGRGIYVCERWRTFENFLADMGEALPGLWLDRIDNTKGYEPGNCRWVTPKESAQNRRRVGVAPDPTSLRQRALAAGQRYGRVYQRVQWGWTVEEALSTPALRRGQSRAMLTRQAR